MPGLAQVLADGVDLRELDARWFRSQLGVVSQVCLNCGKTLCPCAPSTYAAA